MFEKGKVWKELPSHVIILGSAVQLRTVYSK